MSFCAILAVTLTEGLPMAYLMFRSYVNYPRVGYWRYLSCAESKAVLAVLTDAQIGDLQNDGWAKVDYTFDGIRWPTAIIRMAA